MAKENPRQNTKSFAEKWHNSKLRVFLRPFFSRLNNWVHYNAYCFQRSLSHCFAVAGTAVLIYSLIEQFFGISILSVAFLIPELYQRFEAIRNNRSTKYVIMEDKEKYYDSKIEAPDCDKITVFTFCENNRVERNTAFVNQQVNAWLQNDALQKDVRLSIDRGAKKRMNRKLSGKPFKEKYCHFLRFNYRLSQFYARQFTNEKKWGLCSDLKPDMKDVQIQKTCYYDSYLTSIVLGKVLRSTQDGHEVASLADEKDGDVTPFWTKDTDAKMLKAIQGEITMANKVGVTTLMLTSQGVMPIWVQSNQAQSNPGQVVVSGTGSADWSDCERFIGKPDSLRDAVITGMKRELYEESIGTRAISKKVFTENTKTKILGYFRWLEKGGQPEFVGVTYADLEWPTTIIAPETAEVVFRREAAIQPVKTVQELKTELRKLAHPVDRTNMAKEDHDKIKEYRIKQDVADKKLGTVVFSQCNLSSTVTILRLLEEIDAAIQADPAVETRSAAEWLKGLIPAKEAAPSNAAG